ncbi:DUF4232 domain-containing protein [Streptomyces sp. NPDC058954]|uniref:DUF4232 domain-containing protein n=1 Tax=Streptomyces sp. NPDC058954 TaxID=3346677 RepID=UPI0036A43F6D
MSARTRRTGRARLLTAAALAAAALTLTACQDGEGVHDEGASSAGSATASATGKSTSVPGSKDSSSSGNSTAAKNSSTGKNSSASRNSSGSSGSTGAKGSAGGSGAGDPGPTRTRCSTSTTRTTATVVSRPLNHLLLTVTNTGSKNCNLIGYPAPRFGEAQAVPPVFEASKPQAVVTLAPGESGYASVLLSSADGSGSNGYTAKSLEVYFNDGTTAARPSLPAKGVHVDDSIRVSYWQYTMDDALTW